LSAVASRPAIASREGWLAKADDSGSKSRSGADGTRQTSYLLLSFVGCLSLQAGSSLIQFWPCLADGLAEIYQRSLSSYEDVASDGTAGLAGRLVHASVLGVPASSTSEPARSADNGSDSHNVKIAVGA
jgi:hypothetical protein